MLKFSERKDQNKDHDYVKTVSAVLNPNDNGGEAVTLDVDFYHNGDDENAVYANVHIKSQCYGSHLNTQSYFGIDLKSFEEAFKHMSEVSKTIEKRS